MSPAPISSVAPISSGLVPRRRLWTRGALGIALATALAVGGSGLAHAAPSTATTPSTKPAITGHTTTPTEILESISVGVGPLDSALADAVRTLKAAGVDQIAVKAAEAVKASLGQVSPDQITGFLSGLSAITSQTPAAQAVAAPATINPLEVLRSAGIQTFTPSMAPFCATPTTDNPLGLVTAGAGAVAGPWPLATEPTTPINQILQLIPGVTIAPIAPVNLVPAGQTGYAFIPASPTTGGKIQVAWFNTSTLQGGFADLAGLQDNPNTAMLTKLFPALGPIRLAPVTTGKGTILSAVYGTADNGGRTCYFLPAVGIVDAA